MVEEWQKHLRNFENKISSDYKDRGTDFETFKQQHYDPYFTNQNAIVETTEAAIEKRVQTLDIYYTQVNRFNSREWITAQSKFRPTILEEFCGFLFKDSKEIRRLGLGLFSSEVFAGIKIDENGKVKTQTKYVDFCIGKRVNATFEGVPCKFIIPVIAIECKTYLDNTMFSEAQFTAQKLKQGAPNVRTYIIAETNEVKIEQIPSQSPITQVFIARKDKNSLLDPKVFIKLYSEVSDVLKGLAEVKTIEFPGVFF